MSDHHLNPLPHETRFSSTERNFKTKLSVSLSINFILDHWNQYIWSKTKRSTYQLKEFSMGITHHYMLMSMSGRIDGGVATLWVNEFN